MFRGTSVTFCKLGTVFTCFLNQTVAYAYSQSQDIIGAGFASENSRFDSCFCYQI